MNAHTDTLRADEECYINPEVLADAERCNAAARADGRYAIDWNMKRRFEGAKKASQASIAKRKGRGEVRKMMLEIIGAEWIGAAEIVAQHQAEHPDRTDEAIRTQCRKMEVDGVLQGRIVKGPTPGARRKQYRRAQ